MKSAKRALADLDRAKRVERSHTAKPVWLQHIDILLTAYMRKQLVRPPEFEAKAAELLAHVLARHDRKALESVYRMGGVESVSVLVKDALRRYVPPPAPKEPR